MEIFLFFSCFFFFLFFFSKERRDGGMKNVREMKDFLKYCSVAIHCNSFTLNKLVCLKKVFFGGLLNKLAWDKGI